MVGVSIRSRQPFIAALFISFLVIPKHGMGVECQKANNSMVQGHVNQRSIQTAIFFASWCRSCIEHMESFDPKQDIIILAFDTKDSGEEALKSLGVSSTATCFWDHQDSIVAHYQVRSLPATRPAKLHK